MSKKTASKQITKTDAIREELKASKTGSPSEIAKKLVARGIKVTPEYVSTIKASDKRKALSGKPRRGPGRPAGSGMKNGSGATAPGDLKETSELMLKAVELVVKAGPAEAKQLINVAQQMVEQMGSKA